MDALADDRSLSTGISFDKTHEYRMALGEMVMTAGQVEWGVAGLIWQMLSISEEQALAVTDGLQFEAMCAMAIRLASTINSSEAEGQVKRAVAAARDQVGRRNLMVHAVWPYQQDGGFKRRLRLRPPRALDVDVVDIKDVTDKLAGTAFEIQLAQDAIYEATGRRPRNP